MKTIENLKEERTYYKREKDIYGNIHRTPYTAMVHRAPVVVTPGWRFLYFIIDRIFLQIAITILSTIIQMGILSGGDFITYEELIVIQIISISLSFSLFFLYYAFCESRFGGTPAKLIFGYRVIDEYAKTPTFSKTALRAVIRWIPFEAFSCLGDRGWHDKWTKTYVVKKEEMQILQQLLGHTQHREDLLDG